MHWVPKEIELVERQWGVSREDLRQANPDSDQPAHEQKPRDARRRPGDPIHHLGPEDIAQSQDCLAKEVHWKAYWINSCGVTNAEWREDFKICSANPRQPEPCSQQQIVHRTIWARARPDRIHWRKDMQDHRRDLERPRYVLSIRKVTTNRNSTTSFKHLASMYILNYCIELNNNKHASKSR